MRPPGPPTPSPDGWSEAALATLALIAETIVAGDGDRRARLAAEALNLAADPSQVRQLRLVLAAFESRAANLLLTGRAVRFRDLDQAGREACLLAWATSRLPQRRTAYQGLKRLLAFIAYADPGETGTNSRLAAVGYTEAPEPVTDDPTPIRPVDLAPIVAGLGTGEPIVISADIAIVGSGAAGGVIAADAARAGRSVVVLEAGPFLAEPDMPVDELTAFDRLYLNHGFNVSWDAAIMTLAGAGVGGGTTVNWMTCIAPPDSTRLHWARRHGLEDFDSRVVDEDIAALERRDRRLGPRPTSRPRTSSSAAAARSCARRWGRSGATGSAAATAAGAGSAADAGQSSPGCASTSPMRGATAPGSCPTPPSSASCSSAGALRAWRRA